MPHSDVKTKLPQIYNKNCVNFPTIVTVMNAGDQRITPRFVTSSYEGTTTAT